MEEPDASPPVTRRRVLIPAGTLAVFAAAASALATWNPWRLLVLDSRWWSLARIVAVAAAFTAVGFWHPMDRAARVTRTVLKTVGLTAGAALVLASPILFLIAVFHDRVTVEVIPVATNARLVRVHAVYGMGPDSYCEVFELRVGTGLATRHADVTQCRSDDAGSPDVTGNAGAVTFTLKSTSCTAVVDAGALRLRRVAGDCTGILPDEGA